MQKHQPPLRATLGPLRSFVAPPDVVAPHRASFRPKFVIPAAGRDPRLRGLPLVLLRFRPQHAAQWEIEGADAAPTACGLQRQKQSSRLLPNARLAQLLRQGLSVMLTADTPFADPGG